MLRGEPTPRKITRLPEGLINQIAAGEVVERPSAVVKELIENSLDAGASRIEVLLTDGGMTELEVLDNGFGMEPEDLRLSIERHATSKISETKDLEAIGTFGFRGEALSSIAAVSRLTIRTRTEKSPKAHTLSIDFGQLEGELKPTGAPRGTAVVVKNLFEKLPARQKFLKSVATEFSHAAKAFKDVALGNPQAQFFLHHQGSLLYKFIATDRLNRMKEVLKPKWEPVVVRGENDVARVEAYLSPSHLIQSKGELSLYINQRAIRNRSLLQAVRSAYLDTLGAHHEPSGVVYLDIQLDWVDVNVHPQKWEVRCLRQEALYPWLLSTVRKAITTQNTPREMPLPVSRPVEFVSEPLPPAERYSPQPLPFTPPQYPAKPQAQASNFRYLGQIKASYLVCEDTEGLILVDQHALHEKFRFEKLRKDFEEGPLKIQTLLVPLILRLASHRLELLQEHLPLFQKMGFELEPFGDGDIAVKTRPALIEESQVQRVLEDSLQQIADAKGIPTEKEGLSPALHRLFATIACHSVVRANQTLSPIEAQSLLSQIERLEQGWTCPHGRPVLFRIPFPSIEKHFERS